jgi:hypothetical protein
MLFQASLIVTLQCVLGMQWVELLCTSIVFNCLVQSDNVHKFAITEHSDLSLEFFSTVSLVQFIGNCNIVHV